MSKVTATNRTGATSSLVRQKMAMFEKMAANKKGSSTGNSDSNEHDEEEEELPRPPKLGSLVKSRHEWIMKQQSKGFSSPDPLVSSVKKEDTTSGGGSECRNDHVKLVTKHVHHHGGCSDDERDPVDLSSNGAASSSSGAAEPDPIFLGSAEQEDEEPAPEPAAAVLAMAAAAAAAVAAPVPEICFGRNAADDGSVANPMDVSVLGGFDAAEEASPSAAVACLVKHNRSFTRVTVVGNSSSSRGNTPVMTHQGTPSATAGSGSGSGSKASSAAPTATSKIVELLSPVTATPPAAATREALLLEDNHDEAAEVEEGKECDSMINEFDLVRVDSTYHGTSTSPIKWCSETLLITEDEWEAVPKIDRDAVWSETKKPIKWCLDTLLIDNTL